MSLSLLALWLQRVEATPPILFVTGRYLHAAGRSRTPMHGVNAATAPGPACALCTAYCSCVHAVAAKSNCICRYVGGPANLCTLPARCLRLPPPPLVPRPCPPAGQHAEAGILLGPVRGALLRARRRPRQLQRVHAGPACAVRHGGPLPSAIPALHQRPRQRPHLQ